MCRALIKKTIERRTASPAIRTGFAPSKAAPDALNPQKNEAIAIVHEVHARGP
jgi:hypothetical protein